MADYNPHAPQILGEEWVGIRDENISYTPLGQVEPGYRLRIPSDTQVGSSRFYIANLDESLYTASAFMTSIYPAGTGDRSGPIRRVVIPATAGYITGGLNGPFTSDGGPVGNALYNPSDSLYVFGTFSLSDFTSQYIDCLFNTGDYSGLLDGKRIVGFNLLYRANSDFSPYSNVLTVRPLGSLFDYIFYGPLELAPFSQDTMFSMRLGLLNHFRETSVQAASQRNPCPWRYSDLQRFDVTSSDQIRVQIVIPTDQEGGTGYILHYLALEVLYCEETRVAVGTFSPSASRPYQLGVNVTNMLPAPTYTGTVVLDEGEYDVTITVPDVGVSTQLIQVPPSLNGVREMEQNPATPGLRILTSETEGDVFRQEWSRVLPQISLHATGGTVIPASHSYGRTGAAQVYGTNTAAQVLSASPMVSGQTGTYDQVRFYARRFGDTTVPLTLSGSSVPPFSALITPTELDALDDVLDGWREVTLAISPTATLQSPNNVTLTWSAPGEFAGNRWEILSVAAPSISGNAANPLAVTPSTWLLGASTYLASSNGSTINETWMPQLGPYYSTPTSDQSADAVAMLSMSTPAPTGFAVNTQVQDLVTHYSCEGEACCMPTGLYYNRITWGLPVNTTYLRDTFSRTAASGWGTADVGSAWTLSSTAYSGQFSVDSGTAYIVGSGSSAGALQAVGVNFDQTITAGIVQTAVGGSFSFGLWGRYTDINNKMSATVTASSYTNTVSLRLDRTISGSTTTVASGTTYLAPNQGGSINLRFMGYGNYFKMKAWSPIDEEPPNWDLEWTEADLTTGSLGGAWATGSYTFFFEDYTNTPPQFFFGGYELQRIDELDTDWQTVMLASSPAVTGFNDFEARTGLESQYRIRSIGVSDFAGPWSSTLSATVPEPGVTGGDCVAAGHVMIFTTNDHQDGRSNLAYSNAYEGKVVEAFTFPEASMVQLQTMYDRDFFTAFHGTERGGEQFSRELIVQAAAIPPETLADFTSLRDLAWANVSYVCVRDEDGNRWLTSISVPAGTVVNRRRLYRASINITEVTDTPAQVNPDAPN